MIYIQGTVSIFHLLNSFLHDVGYRLQSDHTYTSAACVTSTGCLVMYCITAGTIYTRILFCKLSNENEVNRNRQSVLNLSN